MQPAVQTRLPKRAPRKRLGIVGTLVCLVAVAYPVALLLGACAFRFIGERWWLTGIGLYVPRIVFGLPLPVLVLALLAVRRASFLWSQAVAALVLLFPLMGLTLPRPIVANASGPTIRVLSYNVASGYGSSDFAALVAEVNRYAPDMAFLEEIVADEKLVSRLKEHYAEVTAADQFVVATRFHIVNMTVPDALMVRGHAHHARFARLEVDCPLGRIVFYVVHPISPRAALWRVVWGGRRGLLTGKSFGPANADAFYENAELRERQASTFGDAAQRETDPVIIAGDTNLPDLSWILGRYLSGFQDGFLKAGRGFGYTFPTDRHGPWMRIDRIFASPALRFVHFEVGTSHASDHLCVVADVQRALP